MDSTTNSLSVSIKGDYLGSHPIRQKQQHFKDYYDKFLEHKDCRSSNRSNINIHNNDDACSTSQSTSTSRRLKHSKVELEQI